MNDMAEVKSEFARRLHKALQLKGWNQSELARQATHHMPEGMTIGRDSVSNWLNRPNIPEPIRLQAVCNALGLQPTDLVPMRGLPRAQVGHVPPIEMKDGGDGDTAYLRINSRLPYDIALEIQRLVIEGRKRLKDAEQ
jgi:transcriptional regulator with XRE-family HTH domain